MPSQRAAAPKLSPPNAGAEHVTTAPDSAAPSVWLVAPLVFASGFCALIYQTAWQREFRLIFGVSTAASAAVIAVFMGGLGLGGWILGPRADRHRNPLRFYGSLEAIVGLTAVATPWLLQLSRHAYLALGGTVVLGDVAGTIMRLALASLVLLPPTLFAGGTLGAAARAIEHERDQWRRGAALLYGLNTMGAVAGCAVGTFWMLERFGTRSTLWVAAVVNLIVAAVAIALARNAGEREMGSATRPLSDGPTAPERFVLAAAAIVGFAFFLMELVWYRMLAPILGGTVYTFGLVLAVALAGIALGGLLYTGLFRRRAATATAFGVTCLLEAAGLALPYVLGDRVALLANSLRPPPGSALGGYLPGWTIVTAIVVLPAAVVAGVQFPLLVALLGQGRARIARHIGRAYFWNTMGGIAGALAGGFGLMPVLTAPGCWQTVVVLLAGLSLLAFAIERRGARTLVLGGIGAASLAATMLVADGPTAVWRHGGIGVGRASLPTTGGPNALKAKLHEVRRSISWESEGVESSVAIQRTAALSFVVNGKVDGNTRNDAPVQVMGGLLGALLHPGARRSLVIGLGTGSTAGWLAAVPGMERVDVVELEPAILYVASLSSPVNHAAMENPNIHVVTGDARELLMAGREKYDVMFSEPSNPYRSGVASLFTREFYEGVASRLEPDGVFLQWVQAYEVDDWTISTVLATLNAVFPEIQVWQVHQTDLMFAASRRSLRADAASLRARIKEEPFASALKGAWRALELEDLLARFVAGPEWTRSVRERGQTLNTDDRNQVEFAFARSLSRSERFDVARARKEAAATGADRPAVDGPVDWDRVARQRAAIYVVAGATPVQESAASPEERIRIQALTQYLQGELGGAVRTFEKQPAPPEGAIETTLFAEGLADLGDSRAVGFIKELRNVDLVEAEAATARLAFRVGQFDLAKDALVSAFTRYRTEPWASQVSMSHALSLADDLTLARRDLVPAIFEALGQPFAVAALEESRRLVRLSVESHSGTLSRCHDALAPYEGHVAWRLDVLQYRAQCYAKTGDPRLPRAQTDLEDYKRLEPAAATK